MRKIILLSIAVIFSFTAFSQEFSNKGKDFWVGYGYHQVMTAGNGQNMVLYFATDTALLTNVTVDIPGIGFSQTYSNIPANTVFTTPVMPKGTPDSRILTEGLSNKGIHVTSTRDIVAYAHIYNASVSGSCVLLPTNTLGKEYYSINYDNVSNSDNAYSWMYVIAADTGTTNVEITPTVNTVGGWTAGTTYTISLTQGQIYNIFGKWNGGGGGTFSGEELTGTKVKSIASGGSACKRIAVYSGSGRISINCPNTGGTSSDNYMVQAFPKSAWGKNFLTASTAGNMTNNIYRVCVSDPTAVVKINGVVTGLPLLRGFYYEIPRTTAPQKIESNLPITVAQYVTSQANACGNPGPGDPEVIYLSPVEQSISDVLFNSNLLAANQPPTHVHFVNVIIPNGGTAISSFRLDNATVPAGTFVVHPQDSRYSYARISGLTQTFHRLKSDSGFNAIAYGFGSAESYGYNAGTNVRDLNNQLEVNNPNTSPTETTPSACTGSPFQLKVYFNNEDLQSPPQPIRYDSMKWEVLPNGNAFTPNNFPVMVYGTGVPAEVVPDSVTVKNGRNVAWYSIPGFYTVSPAGNYPMLITVYRTSSEGCGNFVEYPFTLSVTDPPTASFTAPPAGCYLEPLVLTETTPQLPKATYKWWWEVTELAPGPIIKTIYTTRNAVHPSFTRPGNKLIRHVSITTPGCISDTIPQTIFIPDIPNGSIAGSTTVCINSSGNSITFTGTEGRAPFVFSYTIDNGGGPGPVQTILSNAAGVATLPINTTVAGTFIYELKGIRNDAPIGTPCTRNITGQTATVIVQPDATTTLRAGDNANPTVCINTAIPTIRYDIGGTFTSVTVGGLPAGVTYTVVGGVVTITGTPTVFGSFPYQILPVGPCLVPIPPVGGTITVNNDATIALTSAAGTDNQTKCINTLITNIDYQVAGGGTGATIAWTPSVPAGITFTPLGGNSFRISGTPTAAGTFNYTITTTGPCIKPTATGSLIVTPDATVTLTTANNNQTVCVNNVIANIRYTIGGSGNGGSVSGLPAGVTGTYAGGIITISGTPSVPGVFIFTVNPTGPCAFPIPALGGTLTVNDDATIALQTANNNQTKCINTAIGDIDYLVAGGGTGATIAWTPSLPAGITFTPLGGNSFRISGTPTVAGTFNYTITTTGPCIKPTATGQLIITPDATVTLTTANNNQTVCVNNAIATIRYTIGGSGNGGSVSGLPLGVTGTYAGGVITIIGTPTQVGVFSFAVNPTGPCAFPTPPLGGTLTVTGDATIALTTAVGTDNQTKCINSAIADIEYLVAGTGTGATITWTPSTPTGILFTPLGGNSFRISGTPTVSGVFNYTITTTGPCVKPAATGTITVNKLPAAAFTYTIPSCANNTITFTNTTVPNAAGLSTWAWDFGDPGSGSANTSTLFSPTHTFIAPGTYTVKLNAINSNGCVSNPDALQNVVINDTPRAGFIVPEVCINDVATVFTDTSSINGPSTVNRPANKWNYGDPASGPLNNSVGVNGSHLYPAPGNYLVTQIVFSNTGCSDTLTQQITINSADPVSNFSIINRNALCSSDSIQLQNLSTVGFGNVSWLKIYWDVVGAPTTYDSIGTPVFNAIYKHKYLTNLQTTTTYNIKLVAHSGNVCFTTKPDAITINATPKVQFNNIPNSCLLVAPFNLTQGSEIGGVPGSQSYSGPGIINAATGLFDPQVAGVGTHAIKFTWTASNPGSCIDTLTKFITVLDTAHATFSFVTPTCQGVPVSFTDLSTVPAGVTLANTVWNFGDGSGVQNFAPGSTFTHTFPGVTSYTVTMHNLSTVGCLSKDTSAVITIKPNHVITGGANNVQTVCINTPIAPINYTLSGGATGATFSPALPAGLTSSVSGTTLTIQGAPTTTVGSPFNITITTTGNDCIVATTPITITVQPDHSIVLTNGNANQSVCVNTPIDAITYTLSGGATGILAPNNLPPGVTATLVGNTITVSGTPTTTAGGPVFNFSLTTTGNGCLTATIAGSIKVNPYPVPFFAPDKPVYCIPVASVKFNNSSSIPGNTPMTYLWNFDDLASGGLNTSTGLSPTHFFATQRTYDVKLTATSDAILNGGVIGCSKDIIIPLTTIKAQPKAKFKADKPSICIGDEVTFTDLSDPMGGTTISRYWDFNGAGIFEPANPNPTITHTYPSVSPYAPTLYIVNSFGCHSDTLPQVFNVYAYPTVNAGVNRTILEFGSVTLNPTVTGDDLEYLWTPNIYLNNNRILKPTASLVKDDITYKLTVTGRGGCARDSSVFIKVLRFPKIPNTFTPNNDGINDVWTIEYLNSYPNCRVQVFTRAGQLVFESKGYGTPWNGTMKGKSLPFDTYYYIIEPQAGRDPVTGYVTIVK